MSQSLTPIVRLPDNRMLAAVLIVLLLAMARPAAAHLMIAQHGTLHVTERGSYLVLSLPVSALLGFDDDGDGRMSARELRAHAATLQAQVLAAVQLRAGGAALPLEGLLLDLSPPDGAPRAPASQLVVMGRFAATAAAPLWFRISRFGAAPAERSYAVTVTRGSPGSASTPGFRTWTTTAAAPARPAGATGQDAQLLVLTPQHSARELLFSTTHTLTSALELGARHVLEGLDHLLFLLLVVLGGRRPRELVALLSCFTLGHALTLVACTELGAALPAVIVEPAIAATIVVVAVYEAGWPGAGGARRLALVFGCALIHGLGLAGALGELGLRGDSRLATLFAFNLGVELAQLALALAAALLLRGASALAGPTWASRGARLAWLGAVAIGLVWFAERVAGA